MRKFLAMIMLTLGLLFVAPAASVNAEGYGFTSGSSSCGLSISCWIQRIHHYLQTKFGGGGGGGDGSHHAVPELDPATGGSAIVLLLGGVAYIASRRREDSAH